MKCLTYFLGFFFAIALNNVHGLIHTILAQTATFTYEEITYTVNLKKNTGQQLAFNLSYSESNGNTHTVEYQGICGTNIIGVLGETVVNPQGQIISKDTAVQAIFFDLSANSDWEMSGAISQALNLMCDSMGG